MNTPAWMSSISLGTIFVSLFVVLSVGALVWAVLRPVLRSARRTDKTLQRLTLDWFGQEGRPGFPAVPGVPQRLYEVEQALALLRPLVESIDKELHPNGGGSLRDQITKLQAAVETVSSDRVQSARDMTQIKAEVATVTRALDNARTLRALAVRAEEDPGTKAG